MKTVDFSSIRDNPFFWIYFLCSFPEAYDPEEEISISDFMLKNYSSPQSKEWWNEFVQYYDGVFDDYDGYVEDPTAIVIPVGEREFSVQFHPGDTEYYLDGEKIGSTGPHYMVGMLQYSVFREIAASIDDPKKTFLLLPLVCVERSETESAIEYISQVLKTLPISPEHIDTIVKMLINGLLNREEAVFEIKNPQDVIDFILNAGIIQVPPYESERQGDSLYIPTFDMLLTPSVSQMTENSVVIEFNMYIKKFEKQLYECSVGMGKDMKSAVGMSVASFLISFINTLSYMHDKNSPRRITTESSGKTLNWDAYLGNIVAMGEEDSSRKDQDDTVYWEILKDEIKKNLGDQKLSYVKVYAAKYSGDVVGEVHVDNAEIPELSEKVKALVEKWDVQQYRSEKQFFFIEQES